MSDSRTTSGHHTAAIVGSAAGTASATATTIAPDDSVGLARLVAGIAHDKRAADIIILDMRRLVDYADFFVIGTSSNRRQAVAIAEAASQGVRDCGVGYSRIQGAEDARWVLCDLGDVLVHIFRNEARDYYQLELLWEDAPRLDWSPEDPDSDQVIQTGGDG